MMALEFCHRHLFIDESLGVWFLPVAEKTALKIRPRYTTLPTGENSNAQVVRDLALRFEQSWLST